MTNLPNIVRERLKTPPAGLHPDPNLLSAFAEQALSDRERAQVLDHLARCGECRDVVALATPPTQPEAIVTGRDTARVPKAPWLSWPSLRWGALAACVVIVGTAVLMQRNSKMAPMSASAPQQAKLEGDTLHEVAPLSETVGPVDQKEEQKSNKLWFAKRSPTRDDVDELKQGLALPSTRAKSARLLSETDSAPDAAKKRLGFSSGAITASNPVPAPSGQAGELRNLPVTGRNAADLVASSAPPATTETVEVEGSAGIVATEPAALQKDEALGKAKTPATTQFTYAAAPPAAAPTEKSVASAEARSNLRAELYRQHTDVGRWTISSDGQLQHSVDSGKTWQPVTVAEKATFRALSANGPDLWVGGPAGLLYHSTDAGGHWTQVTPSANGAALTADIAALEFTDLLHGKLTTATGEVWVTFDAGQTWRKQP